MSIDFIESVGCSIGQIKNISDEVRVLQQTLSNTLYLCDGRTKMTINDLRSRLNGVLSIFNDIDMELNVFISLADLLD